MDDVEKLKKAILEKTGMSRFELEKLVEKRVKEFAGLLTELGALYTIAKDYGVDVDIDKGLGLRKKIRDLKPGDRDVSVIGRVLRFIPPRIVKKDGRELKFAVVYIYDGTGEARVVLWGRDADLVGTKITRGSVVEIINGKVDEYRGNISVSLGYGGRLLIHEDSEDIPEPPSISVSGLRPGMTVEIQVEIVRSFPVRKKGDIVYGGFIGRDATGEVRVVLWGDNARDFLPGTVVRVFGEVREGRRGLEIHVGEGGYVEVVEEPEVRWVNVKDLEEGMRARILGTVVQVYSTKPFTGRCNVCGGDVDYVEGKFVCTQCGSEDVRVTPMLLIALDDGTSVVKTVLFGDVVKEFCGSFPRGCVEKLRAMLGSYVVVEGVAKKSRVTDTLDFVGEKIYIRDFSKIIEEMFKTVEKLLGEKPENMSEKLKKHVEGSS